MTNARTFWDKRAAKYAASPIADMPAYQYTLQRTASHLSETDRVLEIGCGTGTTALHLAPGLGQIEGTDIAPQMIRIAADKAAAQGMTNTRFRVASAEDAAGRIAGVDAVLAFNIFHLTPNLEAIIALVHEGLPRGGLLISKTPCLAEPSLGMKRFAFAAMIPVMRLIGMAPFVRRLTFSDLQGMMTDAGFDLIETGAFPAMSHFIVARKR